MTKTGKVEGELTYEEAAAELEKLVSQLEEGQLPLEDTLKLYERAQQLAKLCTEMLEKAELRIRTLAAEKYQGNNSMDESRLNE